MSKMKNYRIVAIFGSILLASCGPATPVELVRRVFDAADRNHTEAFAGMVSPDATYTVMNGHAHPLKPADLRVSPACRLTEFGEVRAGIVFASGDCDLKTPYGDRVPIYFQTYLRDGKVVRVDRMVFPL